MLVSRKNFLEYLKSVDFVWFGNINLDWKSIQQECNQAVNDHPQYWCSLVVDKDDEDSWDNIGDEYYAELSNIRRLGYTKDNTRSWETTAARPPLIMDWEKALVEKLPLDYAICRPTLQMPGNIMPWHEDKFFYFRRQYPDMSDWVARFIVFQNDWTQGQIIQAGNSICSHWRAGDVIVWHPNRWHLSANAGIQGKWSCNVTGILHKEIDFVIENK